MQRFPGSPKGCATVYSHQNFTSKTFLKNGIFDENFGAVRGCMPPCLHPNGNGCYFNFSEIISASASVM